MINAYITTPLWYARLQFAILEPGAVIPPYSITNKNNSHKIHTSGTVIVASVFTFNIPR